MHLSFPAHCDVNPYHLAVSEYFLQNNHTNIIPDRQQISIVCHSPILYRIAAISISNPIWLTSLPVYTSLLHNHIIYGDCYDCHVTKVHYVIYTGKNIWQIAPCSLYTVEHGYNELFYNEFMVITNLSLHPVVISVFHCSSFTRNYSYNKFYAWELSVLYICVPLYLRPISY